MIAVTRTGRAVNGAHARGGNWKVPTEIVRRGIRVKDAICESIFPVRDRKSILPNIQSRWTINGWKWRSSSVVFQMQLYDNSIFMYVLDKTPWLSLTIQGKTEFRERHNFACKHVSQLRYSNLRNSISRRGVKRCCLIKYYSKVILVQQFWNYFYIFRTLIIVMSHSYIANGVIFVTGIKMTIRLQFQFTSLTNFWITRMYVESREICSVRNFEIEDEFDWLKKWHILHIVYLVTGFFQFRVSVNILLHLFTKIYVKFWLKDKNVITIFLNKLSNNVNQII